MILIGRMEGNLFQLVDSDGGVFLNEDLPDILPALATQFEIKRVDLNYLNPPG